MSKLQTDYYDIETSTTSKTVIRTKEQGDDIADEHKQCPCSFLGQCFDKLCRLETNDATAFGFYRMGNGPLLMSNVYLSAAFITLAEKQIDCYHEDDEIDHEECGDVYGFRPSSLITIIGTVSGILSALLLPFIGATIDCTDHRRKVGALAGLIMMSVQAIQIGTTQSTWFVMAVLQALNGFIYNIQTLAAYSYLPTIATSVGSKLMMKYSADYQAVMFGMEVVYLLVCIGVALALIEQNDNQKTAQLGQVVNVLFSGPFYILAWYFFTEVSKRRQLSSRESLFTTGFIEVFKTAKGIYTHYSSSLGYFLLAAVVCDSASAAFTQIAVTYLSQVCDVGGQELGYIFLIVLLSTIPGSYFGSWLSTRTNPFISIRIQLSSFIGFNFLAFLTMSGPEPAYLPYIYGAVWGFLLGWFYPMETLIFSIIHPKGQESELAGFFLYCTQILTWLPPLVITIMNESDVHLKWGGMSLNIFFGIGLAIFFLIDPWEKCAEVAEKPNKMLHNEEIKDNWVDDK